MDNSTSRKPPMGLVPLRFRLSLTKEERLSEISAAISRYLADGRTKIPKDWIEEYNDTVEDINN